MASYASFTGSAPSAALTTTPSTPRFTTEYYFTAQAADTASKWLATYTIQEVCVGDQATWAQPSIPPNFVSTLVTCDACETPVQAITCPVDAPRRTGSVTIWGNGVTATATAIVNPAFSDASHSTAQDADTSGAGRKVWWDGPLLTQTGSPTGRYRLTEASGYVLTSDSAIVWGNLALLSGALTLAVGWLLWQ